MSLRLLKSVNVPREYSSKYYTENFGVGIVHLGLGSFHKAHQAAITHEVLKKKPGNWRIVGVSLRSSNASKDLMPQDCLYTLLSKSVSGTNYQIIGSIAKALCLFDDYNEILTTMVSPETKIVSITVTEKAYGFDRDKGRCDTSHSSIARDLANPDYPIGVIGLLVKTLKIRWENNYPAFTILCCDNLPDNGKMVRNAVMDFANRTTPALCSWISSNVAFPSTMVDRITPVPNASTREEATAATGLIDNAAVETEVFFHWIIEDNFSSGRPDWDLAGAIFTKDVNKFEKMKLRMLNGTHSMLAYVGFHCGYKYVRDVMTDYRLVKLIERHMQEVLTTLEPVEGIDFKVYASDLIERFRNTAIAHETFQIAMDGSEKLPLRIFSAIPNTNFTKRFLRPFAFSTAAWLRHTSKSTHDCEAYELRDPRADELIKLELNESPEILSSQLLKLNLVTEELAKNRLFWLQVYEVLQDMMNSSMSDVISNEVLFEF